MKLSTPLQPRIALDFGGINGQIIGVSTDYRLFVKQLLLTSLPHQVIVKHQNEPE